MSKKRDWDEVGETVSMVKELGLSYKEGCFCMLQAIRLSRRSARIRREQDYSTRW